MWQFGSGRVAKSGNVEVVREIDDQWQIAKKDDLIISVGKDKCFELVCGHVVVAQCLSVGKRLWSSHRAHQVGGITIHREPNHCQWVGPMSEVGLSNLAAHEVVVDVVVHEVKTHP